MDRLNVLSSHIGAPEVHPFRLTSGDVEQDRAMSKIKALADEVGINLSGARVRRTSSRFCLAVEHGDYNGTELFGVGTDRFIWLAYKPRSDNKVNIASVNFKHDGKLTFTLGQSPTLNEEISHSWARFPYGADNVLKAAGYNLTKGFDAVLYGNIPGGGMSRSASLSINMILTMFEVNSITPKNLDSNGKSYEIVELAQKVETDYIGSPSGYLDQIMIYYAKAGLGTHFIPATKEIRYVPLGCDPKDFSIGALDTGTDRPGLEKSTYKIRKDECDLISSVLAKRFPGVKTVADLTPSQYETAMKEFSGKYPGPCQRMRYIFEAKGRFSTLLAAWKAGDIKTVGSVFREDGHGLRDIYKISGPELESMCDIVRTVPGVLGERMLGGGDKGASGCIIEAGSEQHVLAAVSSGYPRSRPEMANKWAVHFVKVCDGVAVLDGLL
eukprot:TRINITY_DN3432_c0_g3_i1.p1 TRINITY_DN3432_c0_g3~~TRINITY_DN3432_c0_g3_i1.p1  ORF type:complete len:440 (+),score=87.43 TRINITY_DN3432_c0_g3_i1:82-1401(+)